MFNNGADDVLLLWRSFYTLLGEATASFAGLLFVALALNADRFRSSENRHLVLLARQTFFNLLLLTALSLLILMPLITVKEFGFGLLSACASGLYTCFIAMREERRVRNSKRPTREFFRAYYGPTVIYLVLIFPAVEDLSSPHKNFFVVGVGVMFLLVTSARNAWLLLGLSGS
jgi:hypothetical protein